MLRYARIFFTYAQDVFEYRSLAFVWFLISIINPLLYLFFWQGALSQSSDSLFTSVSDVSGYYFLYLILGGFLMAHIEHEVAYWDIKEGGLVKYILKPIPYIVSKFFLEVTWRITMGIFAIAGTLLLTAVFGPLLHIALTPQQFMLVVLACLAGLLISFTFKMIVGLSALWVVDLDGIEQLVFVATLLFSGYVIPLDMFPSYLKTLTFLTPFPYMVYYPIRMLQGALSMGESWSVLGMQFCWLVLLAVGYRFVWSRGIKRFTGVGE